MNLEERCFNTFAEEKEFKRTNYGVISGSPWGTLDCEGQPHSIDPGIWDIVQTLNKINFIYTGGGQSCSGIPQDHGGFYVDYTKDYMGEIIRGVKQGYIMIRVDTTDPKYTIFKEGLEELCGVELNLIKEQHRQNQMQQGVKTIAIQAIVPEEILDENHPAHQTYLIEVWNNFHKFIKRFILE